MENENQYEEDETGKQKEEKVKRMFYKALRAHHILGMSFKKRKIAKNQQYNLRDHQMLTNDKY